MNTLFQIEYTEVLNSYEKTKKLVLPSPYNTKAKLKIFANHCTTFFATIPLVKNSTGLYSATNTIDAIEDYVYTDRTSVTFTKKNIKELIWIFKTLPRSIFGQEYNALVPVFLYAHKLYNNVEYSEWDSTDERLGTLTSPMLKDAIDNARRVPPLTELDVNIREIRDTLVPFRITDWPMKNLYFEHGEYMYDKALLLLELQLWKANAQNRKSNMLLDPRNIGNMPVALDTNTLDRRDL